ncbi:MAG TPA: mannonate dehydratase [Holophaga sp.]|jgi:mannonate dehydratase|nr:mannonate dehydratase [Holophaga sp.]
MLQSWRWFGPNDPISLREIRQAGVTDIVTALHHVKCGQLWTPEEIKKRIQEVEAAGMRWTVVESLPIHEDIKTRSGDWRSLMEIYKQSLRNLGEAGLKIICYNFMPVLDWTRTSVEMELADGSRVLEYDGIGVAAFDLFILKRPGAEADHPAEVVQRARARFEAMDEAQRKQLSDTILMGLPGTVDDFTIEDFSAELRRYEHIDEATLRANLYGFLNEIMPICDELGVRMAIHPDDPPRTIFGLPRILSTSADVEQLFREVPSENCGLTLCTGSFGGRLDNDPAEMLERFANRVHFVHFRNVAFTEEGIRFNESTHLNGRIDMVRAMTALIREEARRKAIGRTDALIPVRPDHGKLVDCDRNRGCYSGYSYVGRLMGLAELRGLELGLKQTLNRR